MMKRISIRGRVQGVGFRMSTKRLADELGISGSVRNCEDGSVEVVIQGEEAMCREFVAAVSARSPGRIDSLDVKQINQGDVSEIEVSAANAPQDGFHILF